MVFFLLSPAKGIVRSSSTILFQEHHSAIIFSLHAAFVTAECVVILLDALHKRTSLRIAYNRRYGQCDVVAMQLKPSALYLCILIYKLS